MDTQMPKTPLLMWSSQISCQTKDGEGLGSMVT